MQCSTISPNRSTPSRCSFTLRAPPTPSSAHAIIGHPRNRTGSCVWKPHVQVGAFFCRLYVCDSVEVNARASSIVPPAAVEWGEQSPSSELATSSKPRKPPQKRAGPSYVYSAPQLMCVAPHETPTCTTERDSTTFLCSMSLKSPIPRCTLSRPKTQPPIPLRIPAHLSSRWRR